MSPTVPETIAARLANAAFRLDWLEKEVHLLEEKIRFLDDLSFKVKGWAVTVWSGIVTVAVTRHDWRLACISVVGLLAFFLTDASYKRYQICFIQRTRDIMQFLNDETFRAAWEKQGGFPIYDLLNIHTQGQQHDPLAQHWGSLLRPLFKASVGLVYW